jgi:hypothetical protein
MKEFIKVFISFGDSQCAECGGLFDEGVFIALRKDRAPICLTCADVDHLVYLPAGNTALTRRAAQYSTLSAVVQKFSKARKRNERQGVLVELSALEKAEQECMVDSEARAIQRERAAKRRAELDSEYVQRFAEYIRKLFPFCPAGIEKEISEHACLKYSGRVGRSAAAKKLDPRFVRAAVNAHARHAETKYDELLAQGYERYDAREMVSSVIDEVLSKWKSNG